MGLIQKSRSLSHRVMQSSTIEAALIPCTSTSTGLNRLRFSSYRKDLKSIHSHSVGNCGVENVKFGPKTSIGRIFLSVLYIRLLLTSISEYLGSQHTLPMSHSWNMKF